jgi:ribonuclease E
VTLDNESRDTNDTSPDDRDPQVDAAATGTDQPAVEPAPAATGDSQGAAVAGEGAAAAEQPTAAPRRRASRARTTKKVAAAPETVSLPSSELTSSELASSEVASSEVPSSEVPSGAAPSSEVPSGGAGTGQVDQAEAAGSDAAGADLVDAAPAPVKRTRAPRKRTSPRAAPRAVHESTIEPSAADLDTADAVASVAGTEGAAPPVVDQTEAPAQSAALVQAEVSAETAEQAAVSDQAEVVQQPEVSEHSDALFGDSTESAKKPARRRSRKSPAPSSAPFAAPASSTPASAAPTSEAAPEQGVAQPVSQVVVEAVAPIEPAAPIRAIMPLFQAPEPVAPRARRAASRPAGPPKAPVVQEPEPAAAAPEAAPVEIDMPPAPSGEDVIVVESDLVDDVDELVDDLVEDLVDDEDDEEESTEEGSTPRRRRRRGGRGRRGRGRTDADAGEDEAAEEQPSGTADDEDEDEEAVAEVTADAEDDEIEESAGESSGSRRRRRRRRRGASGSDGEAVVEESTRVVTRVRESPRDDVTAIRGSTRLEAKKQRRREGREAGRRKSILTEAEFLTRRESVNRVMVVREREGRTQIGVLEDNVLVEHYVARKTQTSTVGNVYLGRVQNVLPSMEAAFIDIGKGRNAVLYAGEVNWDAAGLDGQPRRIEHALKAGEAVLVQVTKDPIGHKGARLTSQISMPGRYLVYVPDGSMTGISRKLPDTERSRLKKILREIVPDDAGVIVRTAAEGASDEELERDVARLRAQWEDISVKVKTVQAPAMLYGEPDLAIKVVRDIFNEDFNKLIVSGEEAWDTLQGYISHVAPDLAPRLERWDSDQDVFAAHRIDEQLAKGMDRKVWLPSGGSLVIDRTEAMTVVDVNTGKFVGAGGNLEETVTKNNLEAAEEVVHQLRLRDIGGIIVVDFIDMVLESNRDLVLRRLLECLGRDRTRHQVAEVTSLGLVQMTRKRVGQGLLEVFSETCEHCGGRGLIIHEEPVEKRQPELAGNSGGNSGGGGSSGGGGNSRGRGRH